MNQQYDIVNPEIGVIGLKLTKEDRDAFKRNVRAKGENMQHILEMFVALYNKDPDVFSLSEVVSFKKEE